MRIEPFFLDGCAGSLFALYCAPSGIPQSATLICPPFAEEMNKSRRMMALMAHRLSQSGHACLTVDVHGTGDSEGNFDDGRWDIWLDDLGRAVEWLVAQEIGTINLLGIRFGACLAARLATISGSEVSKLIMWQPTIRSNVFMTQFLRLRMVSDLVGSDTPISTKQLREMSKSGESIEIAGYMITPELLASVDTVNLIEEHYAPHLKTSIFEISPSSTLRHSMDCKKLCTKLEETGVAADSFLISGDQFWASTEIVVVPELIDATLSRIQDGD